MQTFLNFSIFSFVIGKVPRRLLPIQGYFRSSAGSILPKIDNFFQARFQLITTDFLECYRVFSMMNFAPKGIEEIKAGELVAPCILTPDNIIEPSEGTLAENPVRECVERFMAFRAAKQ